MTPGERAWCCTIPEVRADLPVQPTNLEAILAAERLKSGNVPTSEVQENAPTSDAQESGEERAESEESLPLTTPISKRPNCVVCGEWVFNRDKCSRCNKDVHLRGCSAYGVCQWCKEERDKEKAERKEKREKKKKKKEEEEAN